MQNPEYSKSKIKKIIILGHTGFIGSRLSSFFEKSTKDIKVIGKSFPEIDLTKYDDVLSLKKYFDMDSVVVMCSALKKEHGDNIDNFFKNINMVANLCRLIETNPVRKFIYFSSAAVYGEEVHNLKISEDTLISPTSYYSLAKYCSEVLLKNSIKNGSGGRLTIIRPPVIYGPGDQPCYGPSGFAKAAIDKGTITLWGDGTEKREFVFVDDIVDIVNRLVFSNFEGVLNIATGNSYSFIEVLEILSSLLEHKINIEAKERTKQKIDHGFDNSKLIKLFPNFSFTPLEQGIKKTMESIKCSIE